MYRTLLAGVLLLAEFREAPRPNSRSRRVTAYVHALAGVLIRNGESGPAIMGGVGVDVRGSGRIGVRLQADVSHDKANVVYATGGRGAVWLVLR